MWTKEIILCLVVDHARTMEIIRKKRQYIKKNNTYFDETVVTKFDLICDNEYKKSFLGTVLIMGLLFGSLLGGFIGDKFGRKTANFLALAAIVPFTIGAGHES